MSIYLVREIKPNDKRVDGSEILLTGEWHILEHFKMTNIATITLNRELADRICYQLNIFSYPKFQDGDLVQLSILIRHYLKEWIMTNTIDGKTSGNYNDAVNCTLGRIMRDSKGHMNPSLVETMILQERKVWEETDMMLPC